MKIGIDLEKINRVQKLLERQKEKALLRVWTAKELEMSKDKNGVLKPDTLAAMFSCKESVAKALGTGFGAHGVDPAEIEVLHRPGGEPYVVLHGKTLEYFDSLGYKNISVSLTHSDENAAAVCIIY
jgi:holo-[acyl-carrier protein] synthase